MAIFEQLPKRVVQTRHGMEIGLVHLLHHAVFLGVESGGENHTMLPGHFIDHGFEGFSDKAAMGFGFAHGDAEAGKQRHIGAHGKWF